MEKEKRKIAIIGDGGWGTALALVLEKKGFPVVLWSAFPEYAKQLNEMKENIKFLPGIKLPSSINIEADLLDAITDSDLLVLAVPSKYMKSVCQKIKETEYKRVKSILSVAKGIETGSLRRMSELIQEELPGVPVAVLSGPSHAEEVAHHIPAAVVVASSDLNIAQNIQGIFMSDRFRVYTSNDVVGVELGGSLKNVIAIAVGICDGLGLGDNAKAALMTRGMAEIARLGVALGGKRETFSGLAGIGDIIVTCISKYGRNLNLGKLIAQGKTLKDILAQTEMVAEGVTTSIAAYELGHKHNVELPIAYEVYRVLHQGKSYKQAIKDLMGRAPKKEMEW